MSVSDGAKSQALSCNKEYKWKCKAPFTVNAAFNCSKPDCAGTVSYVMTLPGGGTMSGNVPFTYTPTQSGTYTVVLYGTCGGKICDSCVVKFVVDCPPEPCCTHDITIDNPTIQLSTLNNPNATIANASFAISGAPGVLFTQLRAEVMSYDLFSNYNNECLNCKSYPFTWASIYQAGPIGAIQPQITMYNATAPSFNPAGNGMYQNPREVIWNGAPPFGLPINVNMQFLLPPASIIACCEITAKICVKFTFRDKDCKECEVISCFTVVIKPGGHDDPQACTCNISPVLSYEGNPARKVSCGETVPLFLGNIPVNLNPGFTCKDNTGKDCPGSSVTVMITKPDNSSQVLSGPNYSYTYLGAPGIYQYTITGNCGGKKCECIFKVNIPK
jgi:hypothetical protein